MVPCFIKQLWLVIIKTEIMKDNETDKKEAMYVCPYQNLKKVKISPGCMDFFPGSVTRRDRVKYST